MLFLAGALSLTMGCNGGAVGKSGISEQEYIFRAEKLLQKYADISPGSRGVLAFRDPDELSVLSKNLHKFPKAFLKIYDDYKYSYIIVMSSPEMKREIAYLNDSEPNVFWKGKLKSLIVGPTSDAANP